MEDERAGGLRLGDPGDRRARVVAAGRIVGPGEHDGHGCIRSLRRPSVAFPPAGRSERLEQVALEPGHEHLRLGIAEPRVELEHARAVVGEHQPREQAADERRAAPGELVDHRLVDLLDERVRVGEPAHGRVRAHAAGVRPEIAVARALEVLRRTERERARAVAERKQRDLAALEQLLDHERAAESRCLPQAVVELLARAADEHPFAGGEPVGLDDAGRPRDRERRRCGDAGRAHHLLREALRAFDPRRFRAGAEDGHARVAQLVGDARDERPLGPDHDEIGGERAREVEQAVAVLRADRVAVSERRDPGVAGRRVQLGERRALRDPPRERVLTRPSRRGALSRAESTPGFGRVRVRDEVGVEEPGTRQVRGGRRSSATSKNACATIPRTHSSSSTS